MRKLTFESRGEYYIIDCDLYHFYGSKPRDFFTAWVLKETDTIVKIPIRFNQYLGEPIQNAIDQLKPKGYNYEII